MISIEIYKLSQDMCFILYLEFKMIDAFTVNKYKNGSLGEMHFRDLSGKVNCKYFTIQDFLS